MDAETLKSRLLKIDEETNWNWVENLGARKRKELEFHDTYRDRLSFESVDRDTFDKIYGNRKYYVATELSNNYVDGWIGESAKGKIFLDYACGNGTNAIKAAKAGSTLAVGIDISPVSVANARRKALEESVEKNTYFLQADAEDTRLPDNSIDRVICSGMLHHLDLSYAFPELRRILAPGGKILVVEALNCNPAIKLYRHLTPGMRTEWEKNHILGLKDVEFARRFFTVGEVRYWHILSILAPYMKPFLRFFNEADKVLTRIPLVRLMAWIFTFELGKKSG